MTHPQPTASKPALADTPRKRWRTVYMDGDVLQATAEARAGRPGGPEVYDAGLRVVARARDEIGAVRRNVRDAAAAVLAWLAAVVAHDDAGGDLDGVLDRCLRPGPDVERVNYAAMAAEIEAVTGVSLSPRRVQTAVLQLRAARGKRVAAERADARESVAVPEPGAEPLHTALRRLDADLRTGFDELSAATSNSTSNAADGTRRELGTAVLTAVRAAAGRVIDRDFGEGIPERDVPHTGDLEDRFLTFVRDAVLRRADDVASGSAPARAEPHLRRLLVTLAESGARAVGAGTDAENDVNLVMHGARVVGCLLGVDSLPGIVAQLNVLVTGRAMIQTDLYVAEMLRLAGRAEALHADAETKRYLTWVRRLPEDRRLPSALRVASYCRSNAATRIYDRVFDGALDADTPALADATRPPRTYRQLADAAHDAMLARDGGCTLTLTGALVRHTVSAKLDGDDRDVRAHLEGLGEDKALERLEALIKFENNDALVRAARGHVVAVYPALATRLICAG